MNEPLLADLDVWGLTHSKSKHTLASTQTENDLTASLRSPPSTLGRRSLGREPMFAAPQTTDFDAEFAVVGLGAMGANALWRLAARGVEVIGFEQFRPGHPFGSTHGHTRLVRTLCLEHPNLVTFGTVSLDLFRELEAEQQVKIIDLVGLLNIGPANSNIINNVQLAADTHDRRVRRLSASELQAEFPQHAGIEDDTVALHDPQAGIGRPEAAVVAAVSQAEKLGAQVVTGTEITGWDMLDNGVAIRTAGRTYRFRQVVVTTGSWLAEMIPELPLQPIRQPMTWFRSAGNPADFHADRFPGFIRDLGNGRQTWGHGSGADYAVKVGPEDDPAALPARPNEIDRSVSTSDWAYVSELVAQSLPGLDPIPFNVSPCVITRTPDHQFVVGRPFNDPRLLIGGGCHGHAFKHGPAIGETLARMAFGDAPLIDLSFVDPTRFTSH